MSDPMDLPGVDRGLLANGEKLKDVVRMYRLLRLLSKSIGRKKAMIDKACEEIEIKYRITEITHDKQSV